MQLQTLLQAGQMLLLLLLLPIEGGSYSQQPMQYELKLCGLWE
jgi:hypothetical protein